MYCKKCGHEIKDTSTFCRNCGNQISYKEGAISNSEVSRQGSMNSTVIWIVVVGLILISILLVLMIVLIKNKQKSGNEIKEKYTVEIADGRKTEDVEAEKSTKKITTEEIEDIEKSTQENRTEEIEKVYAYGTSKLKIMEGIVIYSSQYDSFTDYNASFYKDGQGRTVCCIHDGEGFEFNYIYDEKNDTYTDWNNPNEIYRRIENEDDLDYIIPCSSSRLIGEDDIKGLTVKELNYAKNEIYARHGYMFESLELQNYFGSKAWYQPRYEKSQFDQCNPLSDIENKNAAFLSEKEKALGGYKLDN